MKSIGSSVLGVGLGAGLLLGCGGEDGGAGTTSANMDDGVDDDDDGDDDGGPSEERPEPPEGCGDGSFSGSVYLERGPSELERLEGVSTIEGDVVVDKTDLADLSSLSCLVEIKGDLHIFGNTVLTDMSGLDALWHVDGNLVFSENDALTDYSGLPGLTRVGRPELRTSVVLNTNRGLTEISGFSGLRAVHGEFYIQYNPELLHMDGFDSLRVMDGVFAVTHNPQLCVSSIEGVGYALEEGPYDGSSIDANDPGC